SGIFDVAADRPHHPLEYWVFSTTRWHSVDTRAADIEIPADLDKPARIHSGARLYDEMCAQCHLRPGMEPTALHQGLNPEPPLLDEWSEEPGYTFLIVKRGVRSTGMPAWGATHDDAALWDVVAFQRQMPDLTAREYEAMVRDAEQDAGHEH
ncbi:MAG: cytochrome c, partial [Proteobacteria bacterium]|nr:cytochrome c [Pseudomonadota bacterium]